LRVRFIVLVQRGGNFNRKVTMHNDPIMYDDPTDHPLMRVRDGALIAGVCGGIAKWLGWDPTLVRFGYVVLSLLSAAFPGILVYILLWILMPQEPA
jgi:phage shock protein PspC (stress-responsive transcriptional regulator)